MSPDLDPEIRSARRIVFAWEKLRLLYNLILFLPGVAVGWSYARATGAGPAGVVDVVGACLVVGVMANVFFCLGPYAELLVVAKGYPHTAGRLRWFLFGLGLLLSLCVMSLAWITIAVFSQGGLLPTPP